MDLEAFQEKLDILSELQAFLYQDPISRFADWFWRFAFAPTLKAS